MLGIENRAAEIESSLKFIYELEKEQFEELILIKIELFEATKKVIHLIDACRLEKKMIGITERSRELAKKAFLFKPIEKTLHFYLEGFITNKKPEEAISIVEKAFEEIKVKDDSLVAVKDLYLGSLFGVGGDYYKYNKLICAAKKKYEKGIYYQLKTVVSDFYCGADEKGFLGVQDSLSLDINSGLIQFDYIFSVSCDAVYFEYYGEIFLNGFFESNKSSIVHLYVIESRNNSKILEFIEKKWYSDRVVVSFFKCPDSIDFRPISAVLRLLAVDELLKKYNKPVFFGEIDALVTKSLNSLVSDLSTGRYDQLVRVIGHHLPWQRFTCGLGAFMPTKSGFVASALMNRFIKGIFNNNEKHWWADQCALEGSIRYSFLINSEYNPKFVGPGDLGDFIITPTGADSHEKKVFILNKKYKDIYR